MTPSRKPENHHTIPRFHIARWADASGLVDFYNIRGMEARPEDPRRVGVVPDINRMSARDGSDDPWLEHQLFNGFETAAAKIMRSIEHAPKPLSVPKQAKGKDIRGPHFLTFGQSVSFGLYVGSLCVRSAAWRDALRHHTVLNMKAKLDAQTRDEIAQTTDPARIAELEKRFGIRLMAGLVEGNGVPWLSGHLAVRLGEVLATQYVWAVFRVPEPTF